MKILMVSMRSFHFNRWVEQLKDSGHEVYWFNIQDDTKSTKLPWVKQFTRKRNPLLKGKGSTFLKKQLPFLYRGLRKMGDRTPAKTFEDILQEVKPDVVHSFAMQMACVPIIEVMERHPEIPWMYSSWGSDIFFHEEIGIPTTQFRRCLQRIDLLITDNLRDHTIAASHGFNGTYLGSFPGNGGIDFQHYGDLIKKPEQRQTILIKGYDDQLGKAGKIIEAIDEPLAKRLAAYRLVIFSADKSLEELLKRKPFITNIEVLLRDQPVSNDHILRLMCDSYLYLGNSISDGMPNTLLEAAGLGAFPIQSNPGDVTREVIEEGENGLLIHDPENVIEIREKLILALERPEMVEKGFDRNIVDIPKRFGRQQLRPKVIALYEEIL